MSIIEYLVVPVLIAKISGWQLSHPFHAECFLCEKMISFIPGTFASMSMSLGISSPLRLKETPSMKSTGLILPVASASSQPMPLPNRSFGSPAVNAEKSYFRLPPLLAGVAAQAAELPVLIGVGFRTGRKDLAVLVVHLSRCGRCRSNSRSRCLPS